MYFYEEYSIEYILGSGDRITVDKGCSPGFHPFDSFYQLMKDYYQDGWDLKEITNATYDIIGVKAERPLFQGFATEITKIYFSAEMVDKPQDAVPLLDMPDILPPQNYEDAGYGYDFLDRQWD